MVTVPVVEMSAEPPRLPEPDPEVLAKAKQRVYGAAYNVRILNQYEGLSKAGKGALLRREGLYSSLIDTWRKQRDHGALTAFRQKRGRPQADPRDREVARLRKETGPSRRARRPSSKWWAGRTSGVRWP